MIGMVMMMPDLSFNPGGSASAGTPGGGGLPTDASIPTLSLSLALVPFGLATNSSQSKRKLAAVAVFPPFARYVKGVNHGPVCPSLLSGAKKIFNKRRRLSQMI